MLAVDSLSFQLQDSNLWERSLEGLRHTLGESVFYSWIEPMDFMGVLENQVILATPNELARNWVERHYAPCILDALRQEQSDLVGIRLEIRSATHTQQKRAHELSAQDLVVVTPTAQPKHSTPRQVDTKIVGSLYADYRFETFVVGECNRLAHSVSTTVAQAPGENHYNPLVLYGHSGMGKTHLLQAIGRHAVEHETAQKVVYRTADDFLKDYMRAVRERRPDEFYRTYETCDLLILDDLQFLAKKVGTQEELFKIFTRLLSKKKQIVLSCDQIPSDIEGLDQRLLNRFESGLCCSVNPMDLQTRLDFLHRKASAEGFGLELSEDSFRWLATHFRSNVRELEGVLVKLLGLREIMQVELSLDNIRRMVGEVVRSESRSLSLTAIAEATAMAFNIKPELLSAKSRVQAISLPRKIAIKLCRELTDHSLEGIGYLFNRDYSTIIASLKTIEVLLAEDCALRDKVDEIRASLLS